MFRWHLRKRNAGTAKSPVPPAETLEMPIKYIHSRGFRIRLNDGCIASESRSAFSKQLRKCVPGSGHDAHDQCKANERATEPNQCNHVPYLKGPELKPCVRAAPSRRDFIIRALPFLVVKG